MDDPSLTTEVGMSEPQTATSIPTPHDRKLPVTLLSGFLGAGKTTLLTNILRSQTHGLRIGIIVNDIGQVNIDGALLTAATRKLHREQYVGELPQSNDPDEESKHSFSVISEERNRNLQKIVEMQNGCICCTLRPELLTQVAEMAKEGRVDYLIVESSGVSEPMQVAETFAPEFTDMMKDAAVQMNADGPTSKSAELTDAEEQERTTLAALLAAGGLPEISRLDTCVTVVDAANVFADFETADFLIDRNKEGDVPEEDDRNISDLMVDQLEFANVIVLNKTDLVAPSAIPKLLGLIKALNPTARIVQCRHAQLDPHEVLNTHSFSFAQAAMAAGWLRSLQEVPVPEIEEYGIGTFVYRARRPFHPERLWREIRNVFVVIQEDFIDDGQSAVSDDEMTDGTGRIEPPSHKPGLEDDLNGPRDHSPSNERVISGDDIEEDVVAQDDAQPQLNPKARLASKKASPTWSPLLRSKGFFWLATRPIMFGEWSQAGVMLTLTGGGCWKCTTPKSTWSDDPAVIAAIEKDFEAPYGDRRQEIVFIGLEMSKGNKERIIEAMDACLLTDAEMLLFDEAMNSREDHLQTIEEKMQRLQEIFEDGFEDWNDPEAGHQGHDH